MEIDPPLRQAYKDLLMHKKKNQPALPAAAAAAASEIVDECELPLIDLRPLILAGGSAEEREKCKTEMARASEEWGFFQVVNHGVSPEILDRMRREQVKAFKQPFDRKKEEDDKFSAGTYRWGTPTATCLNQLAWSEAFHIPMTDVVSSSSFDDVNGGGSFNSLRYVSVVLCFLLFSALHEGKSSFASRGGARIKWSRAGLYCIISVKKINIYIPMPPAAAVFGLMPHTDSDFLTILYQDDQVGGLQLVKDGKCFAVKPNPQALIVNIGDLFQAWSNGVYKSVEHRVVTNPHVERFSTAYFFCPSYDTEIESRCEPSIYRKFSFKEYRQQVQEDVGKLGRKVGLSRFTVNAIYS
ncbi:unnamed protein product [Linum tenue]|uniref:Fe2OG dioxygenase domain-containing protein n=2 Tax=Linum tenue TaxID=586396 RepID=A0AAV0JEW1_9ROSI|nr:unnamed protein product [Linum tenue]